MIPGDMRDPDHAREPADRTVIVEGPFQAAHERDDHWAQATIDAHGRQYRVAAVVPGQADFHYFFGMTDEEREDARGWFALIELARCPAEAFESSPGGHLPEVTVRIAHAGPLQRWTIEDVQNYAHEKLRGYALEREGSTWRAHPVTRQAQPAARPRPPQAPEPPQPRSQPRPAASGQKTGQWRPGSVEQLVRRPLKITYDREDAGPRARTEAKKSIAQTFLDLLAEAIKNLRRG